MYNLFSFALQGYGNLDIPPEESSRKPEGIIISSCKYCMRIGLTACGKVFSRNCSVRSKRNLLFAYSWPQRTSTLHFMKRGSVIAVG